MTMNTEELKQMAEKGVDWIKKNPTQAAMVGVGAGFALGFFGIARLALGVRTLAAVPGVSDMVMDFAAKNFGGGEAMDPEIDPSLN